MWAKLIAAIRNRFVDETHHQGATEGYYTELHSMVVEKELDDTGNFDGSWLRTHLDLEDIEQTAIERIKDVCQLTINTLNNDIWWKTCASTA